VLYLTTAYQASSPCSVKCQEDTGWLIGKRVQKQGVAYLKVFTWYWYLLDTFVNCSWVDNRWQ